MRISDWSSDVCSSDLKETGTAGAKSNSFAVADLWRTLIDLEEEFVPSATIGDKLADTSEGAIFEYETDRPFDFDSESSVEVRSREGGRGRTIGRLDLRSEEHTTELQSLMRTSSPVLCLTKKNTT